MKLDSRLKTYSFLLKEAMNMFVALSISKQSSINSLALFAKCLHFTRAAFSSLFNVRLIHQPDFYAPVAVMTLNSLCILLY